MSSILSAFLLLWGCLYVQTSAKGPLFTIISLDRYDFGNWFQLRAVYESSQPLVVAWEGPGDKHYEPGIATLDFDRKLHDQRYATISLFLGNFKSQYFRIVWNCSGSGNVSASMDLAPCPVNPGTDVVYSPGTAVNVTITTEHLRANGQLEAPNPHVDIYAVRKHGDKLDVYTKEKLPFYSVSARSSPNTTWTNVHLKETGNKLINVLLSGFVKYVPTIHSSAKSLIKEVYDITKLTVHDRSHAGPFPAGFVHVEFFLVKGDTFTCSRKWPTCLVSCFVWANDVQEVKLQKVGGKAMKREVLGNRYSHLTMLSVDPSDPDTPGQYLCQASSKDGSAQKTLTVLVD